MDKIVQPNILSYAAIQINDNAANTGTSSIGYNNINNYIYGISDNCAFAEINNNTIKYCIYGINSAGAASSSDISQNTISSTLQGNLASRIGIYGLSGSPFIIENHISNQINGLELINSSPKVACNEIHNNTSFGIFLGDGSILNMNFGNFPVGSNLVYNNTSAQLYCDPNFPFSKPIIANGQNVFAETSSNLLAGKPAVDYQNGLTDGNGGYYLNAIGNWWGLQDIRH